MVQDDHPGTEELERRLAAYAFARLSPRPGSDSRIRAALIEEARMRSLAASIADDRRRGAGRRRFAALLLAAGLAIVGVAGVAAASTAGGPLYDARLWLETATLPSNADARALERIHQIDARVLDLQQATASGDQNAVAAAIAAYRDAVAAALTEAGNDADRLTHLRAALGLHVTVLETLAGRVPDPAMQAIDRAIVSSDRAIEAINKANPDHGGPGAGGGGGPAWNEQPGSTHKPASSDKPVKTDHPTPGGGKDNAAPAPDPTPSH
jgi:hypothetical protein